MIVGRSPGIIGVLAQLDRFAPSTGPVLITGESGTGKELIARALHYSSPRAARPFLAINCAAIPETLFESELFGYVRGAFTGAVTSRSGVFEAAQGGTVFLDEIGELPITVQAKLLRVLESGEITRLGSNVSQQVQFRLVSATNRPLEKMVQQNQFREDLYYRVRVFPLALPPLRDRPEDIPLLIFHSLSVTCEKEHQPMPKLSSAALAKLLAYPWPGNVRELVNVLHRALLHADRGEIDAAHISLPDVVASATTGIVNYRDAKAAFEERYFTQLLGAAAGNITTAAKLSQKTRKEIYDALKRHNLDPERFRIAG
jgi:two-component system, NtrC family, response regulator GlrR